MKYDREMHAQIRKQKADEFQKIVTPVIKWLNENYNLHTQILIEPDGARIMEDLQGFKDDSFID